jgi:hypothetical protein
MSSFITLEISDAFISRWWTSWWVVGGALRARN